MLKLKGPIKPAKPRAPTEPKKFLRLFKELQIYDGLTLAEVLESVKGVIPEQVSFYFKMSWGEPEFGIKWLSKPELNPQYNRQMRDFEKKKIIYDNEMKAYTAALKEYEILYKKYLKNYHENELKKLYKKEEL